MVKVSNQHNTVHLSVLFLMWCETYIFISFFLNQFVSEHTFNSKSLIPNGECECNQKKKKINGTFEKCHIFVGEKGKKMLRSERQFTCIVSNVHCTVDIISDKF